MANTILTPTAVTREALRILHQKLNFVGNVVREYDSADAVKVTAALEAKYGTNHVSRSAMLGMWYDARCGLDVELRRHPGAAAVIWSRHGHGDGGAGADLLQ